MDNNAADKKTRLVSFISKAGIASRRKAFDLIMSGRISVNGNVVREPSAPINNSDTIKYDGAIVHMEPHVYIILNKPKGYTCTNDDPHAEKKAVDLIAQKNLRLFSAGRLDKDSEGLIIFTNDGDFVNLLTHPRNEVMKKYEVSLDRELAPSLISELKSGIADSGETLRAYDIKRISKGKYLFTLTEGKKREIRRMAKYADASVISLTRIKIGSLELGDLPSGKWRKISEEKARFALRNV